MEGIFMGGWLSSGFQIVVSRSPDQTASAAQSMDVTDPQVTVVDHVVSSMIE